LLCLIQSKKCVNVCKQLPFYFLCVFWGIYPTRKNARVLCRGSSPPILYVPMFPCFFPMKMGKKWGNKMRVVYVKGRFPYLCVLLLRLGNTIGLTSFWCPSLSTTYHPPKGTSPTNKPLQEPPPLPSKTYSFTLCIHPS
jgi:hypothetical protein